MRKKKIKAYLIYFEKPEESDYNMKVLVSITIFWSGKKKGLGKSKMYEKLLRNYYYTA